MMMKYELCCCVVACVAMIGVCYFCFVQKQTNDWDDAWLDSIISLILLFLKSETRPDDIAPVGVSYCFRCSAFLGFSFNLLGDN
jgi:hypothetical protein